MRKQTKNKKITIDSLAIMVAEGFNRVEAKIEKMEIEIGKVKESIKDIQQDILNLKESVKDIRHDILNLGDRFVSYHTFDALANRVKVLEEKRK